MTTLTARRDLDVDPTTRTECLELLLAADDAGRTMSTSELASRVATRDPRAVGAVVDELVRDGALTGAPEALALTGSGREVARSVVRKHMLAERLLRDVIGLDWSDVHRQARLWELVISDEIEAKLVELMDDPGTCPHGNPMPGSPNRPDQSDAILLAEAGEGPFQVVRIGEELEEDDEALRLLERAGLTPGAAGEVLAIRDGDLEVAGSVADAVVPAHVARQTFVRR